MIGKISDEKEVPLLPICHTLQNAHIQLVIDADGNFLRASIITKNEAQTIIPCTENSAGRTGRKPKCHPLCDSLQFIAGDFLNYGGVVTSGYLTNPQESHDIFLKTLGNWCDSEHKHEKAIAILKYVKKNRVITDLISEKILYIDNGKLILMTKDQLKQFFGSEKNIPEIFGVIQPDSKNKTIDQSGAFIRWCVEKPGESQSEVWSDHSLWDSWIGFYSGLESIRGLCFVTGEEKQLAMQHPKRIRRGNDRAKLISSNDTIGYTFRGRFAEANQVCGVGFEVTQKVHSALRWLISRQGYRSGDQAIVAWATSGKEIPDPLGDPLSILGEEELKSDDSDIVSTAQNISLKFNKKIAGYKAELGDTSGIVVMGIDSATKGRMAITFYRELTGSDFLERVEKWHKTCEWIHDYVYIEDKNTTKKKKKHLRFIGAPAPKDIAVAAYGSKVDDKLKKKTVERLLPCIIDGQKIPKDIVDSAVRRACNRAGMDEWEWNKTLSIACSLYKKFNEKEEYIMALDENRKTRDYLYGRLLALADSLEQWALNVAGEKRQTNAARLMQRFADHPYSTWRTIEISLAPYKARLGGKANKRQDLIDQVHSMFDPPEDFTSDRKLSGEFLLGYHCQREALRKKSGDTSENEPETVIENNE
jgi:CRISPR-associated protein Csd1